MKSSSRIKYEQAQGPYPGTGRRQSLNNLEEGKSKEELVLEFPLDWNNASRVLPRMMKLSTGPYYVPRSGQGIPEAGKPLHDGMPPWEQGITRWSSSIPLPDVDPDTQ